MFYCNPCAIAHNWPTSAFRSYGRCELCKIAASCNDVPSKYLPSAQKTEKNEE